MNNVIAVLIKLLLFTVILAVSTCMCIYFNDNIVFLLISFF